MKITYALLDREGHEYSEEAAAAYSLSGKLPCKAGNFDGLLRLAHEGQVDIVIRDDLHDLVPSACVEAVTACLTTGSGRFALGTVYAQFGLTMLGDQIRFEEVTQPPPNDTQPRLYPKAEFVAQMHDCARRFEHFLSTLVKTDTDWQAALDRLRSGLRAIDTQDDVLDE